MLNVRNEESNTVFYSDLACRMNTATLNMYISVTCRVNPSKWYNDIFIRTESTAI